jgi:hypothetical protein
MSIFSSILHKIFDHTPSAAASPASGVAAAAGSAPAAAPATPAQAGQAGQTSAATAASPQLGQADVAAILTDLATKKGGGGNWQTSIVDLLRLLDLNPSLDARKQLAELLSRISPCQRPCGSNSPRTAARCRTASRASAQSAAGRWIPEVVSKREVK